jgi:hypothetical protein
MKSFRVSNNNTRDDLRLAERVGAHRKKLWRIDRAVLTEPRPELSRRRLIEPDTAPKENDDSSCGLCGTSCQYYLTRHEIVWLVLFPDRDLSPVKFVNSIARKRVEGARYRIVLDPVQAIPPFPRKTFLGHIENKLGGAASVTHVAGKKVYVPLDYLWPNLGHRQLLKIFRDENSQNISFSI